MAEGSDGQDKKHAPRPSDGCVRPPNAGDVARSPQICRKAAAIVLVITIGLNAAASVGDRFEAICAAALTVAGDGGDFPGRRLKRKFHHGDGAASHSDRRALGGRRHRSSVAGRFP